MSTHPSAGQLRPQAELSLEPDARSVAAARRFLRDLLRQADRDRWCDTAELALSEIVTNGVLHARTELRVRVWVQEDQLEVEVADSSPMLPTQRRTQDPEATTGRGLELVAALTRECGVRPESRGKAVWFVVSDTDAAQEPSEQDLLDAWDLEGGWSPQSGCDPASSEQSAVRPEVQEVLLQAMPVNLWMAAREHHRAVLRELMLYLAEHADSTPDAPDLALADEARNLIWNALLGVLDRATGGEWHLDSRPGSPPDVPRAVDVPVAVPAGLGAAFAALQDALDLGEGLAVADRLLVRPGLPEIVEVRDWACEQVIAQLAGVPPAPWPGTSQTHFADLVRDRADPGLPVWDSSLVTESERGVAAADDANRIIAISRPLARALGWEPEEVVGRRVVALIPPELREAHVAGFSRHLNTGQTRVLGQRLQLPVLRKDGTTVPCDFLVEHAPVGRGRPVYLAWIEPLGQ